MSHGFLVGIQNHGMYLIDELLVPQIAGVQCSGGHATFHQRHGHAGDITIMARCDPVCHQIPT